MNIFTGTLDFTFQVFRKLMANDLSKVCFLMVLVFWTLISIFILIRCIIRWYK